MGSVDRKLQTLENVARLRRAQRHLGRNRDLSAVRASLERGLGPTVSRRIAARLLGVSHTALARWIKAGDLPIVYTANGRTEVPVPALLDLYDDVDSARRRGGRTRHLLEPSLARGRERAARLDTEDLSGRADAHDRERAERFALAYHRAVADRLTRRMVDEARHRVWRWRDDSRLDPRYAEQWEAVLDGTLDEIRETLRADTSDARDLRQNSPFSGMLSEPERRAILAAID